MLRFIYIVLFYFMGAGASVAQIRPAEDARLNYRIIGFSFPETKRDLQFTIEIAAGRYNNEDSFQQHIITTVTASGNRAIAEVPEFGWEYTWRIVGTKKNVKARKSDLHHFKTQMSKWVNPDSVRLRIINSAKAHSGDYVFLDGNKALYDMTGKPVWFMPLISASAETKERPRDIKITPFGTVTLLLADQVYEVNYEGKVVWKGPGPGKLRKSMDSITNFHHHELTRLSNGNYMTFGFEHTWWELPGNVDSLAIAAMKGKIKRRSNNKFYQDIVFGKLVEYDANGRIVWQWNSGDYFKKSDLYARTYTFGIFDLDDTHANAFYFDEKEKTILISFRNLYRVIKIKYPTGETLNTYGTRYVPGAPHTPLDNGLFCGQHSCRMSQEGYLYVFNNNICHPQHEPTIIMMRESALKKDSLEKVWEFECPMDELTPEERAKTVFNAGGSVYELPDKTFLCCMGSGYGKTLLVNRDKTILWCAQPEIWKDNKWINVSEYRASIITRSELEKLIWNEPLDK
jgi:hypothetical protein